MTLLEKIRALENRDYDHDDQAENITDQINRIIEISEPNDRKHANKIEDEIVWLLSEFRYEGHLEIENDH